MAIEGWMITTAVTIGGFIWHAAYFEGKFSQRISAAEEGIKELKDDIKCMKKKVRFKDTCNARHNISEAEA